MLRHISCMLIWRQGFIFIVSVWASGNSSHIADEGRPHSYAADSAPSSDKWKLLVKCSADDAKFVKGGWPD
jgi:hypothetical protein